MKRIEFLEMLNNVNEGKFENFLEDVAREKFEAGLYSPSFSGWYYDIILSKDGLRISNARSTTTMDMDEFKGEAITICSIPACNEFDSIITRDILTEDQEEKINNYIEKNNLDYSEIEIPFKELFPEEYEELKGNTCSYMWEIQKNVIYDAFYELIDDIEKGF